MIDAQLDCTNEDDNTGIESYQGESRGLSSRCINGRVGSVSVPGCFEIQCDETLNKVLINGQVCDFDGQELDVTTRDFTSGRLECPALATICPDLFCPGECSGRGVCDYSAVPAKCNCDDETDTTAACSKDTPVGTTASVTASITRQCPNQQCSCTRYVGIIFAARGTFLVGCIVRYSIEGFLFQNDLFSLQNRLQLYHRLLLYLRMYLFLQTCCFPPATRLQENAVWLPLCFTDCIIRRASLFLEFQFVMLRIHL